MLKGWMNEHCKKKVYKADFNGIYYIHLMLLGEDALVMLVGEGLDLS
jgi:hypothetical protein